MAVIQNNRLRLSAFISCACSFLFRLTGIFLHFFHSFQVLAIAVQQGTVWLCLLVYLHLNALIPRCAASTICLSLRILTLLLLFCCDSLLFVLLCLLFLFLRNSSLNAFRLFFFTLLLSLYSLNLRSYFCLFCLFPLLFWSSIVH